MRKTWPTWIFLAAFAGCILFAYAWFNLPSTNSELQSPNSQPRLWLSARTNIPGYVFIPEPVSDAVKKTLGTTNILSGTFYKITDRSLEYGDRSPLSDVSASGLRSSASDLRPLKLASTLEIKSDLPTLNQRSPNH